MKLSYIAIYITTVINFTIIVVNCVGTEKEEKQNGMGMVGDIWMWVFGILLLIVIVFLIMWMVKQIRK